MKKKLNESLVIFTSTTAALILAALMMFKPHLITEKRVKIPSWGQINYGDPNAPIKVFTFEDPNCAHCKKFFLEDFDKIKEDFIDTGKVHYTAVTLTFLGSQEVANAAHCVYEQNPNAYPLFLKQYYEKGFRAPSSETFTEIAQSLPGIDADSFNQCRKIRMGDVYFFENNQTIAKKSMREGKVGTPTMFVNGRQQNTASYKTIAKIASKMYRDEEIAKK